MDHIQILGWAGSGMLLLAYLLFSCRKLSSKSIFYQVLNFFGAIAAGILLRKQEAWSMLSLEIIWAGIAGVTLLQLLIKKWHHVSHEEHDEY